MTTLQDVLRSREAETGYTHLSRDFRGILEFFRLSGVDLRGEIWGRLLDDNTDLCVLDAGCGSGEAIEQIARSCQLTVDSMRSNKKIQAIGVDLNPIDQISPETLNIGDSKKRLSELVSADLTELPLRDNSVDVVYSVRTLLYVPDSLRALEELYRVTKIGGIGLIDAQMSEISLRPGFQQIINETPGAKEVFRLIPAGEFNFIFFKKSAEDHFNGFPFELKDQITMLSQQQADLSQYCRGAVYQALGI